MTIYLAYLKTKRAEPEAQIWHELASCEPYYSPNPPRGLMGDLFIKKFALQPGEENLPIDEQAALSAPATAGASGRRSSAACTGAIGRSRRRGVVVMVAFSFKKRFVGPIQAGLEQYGYAKSGEMPRPKLQTIRAGTVNGRDVGKSPNGRRLGAEGDMLQLYCGMRTKQCFSIGVARCTGVYRVIIWIADGEVSGVMVDGELLGVRKLAEFIQADGFADHKDMGAFWAAEHPGVDKFEGVLIKWEPLKP